MIHHRVKRIYPLNFSLIGISLSVTFLFFDPSIVCKLATRFFSKGIACTSRLAFWSVPHMLWESVICLSIIIAPKETAKIINKARAHKKSICVVGTSTVRTLETVVVSGFQITSRNGWTDKFIYPPYDFKMCDKFITNFHQPKSTLMMLTAAFAKKDFILNAYKEAIKKKYRFYSYGDSMIII